MKKKFLKPFAATVGTLIASTSANAAVSPIPEAVSLYAASAGSVAGGDVVLGHAIGDVQNAAHASHASHSSHASHASHASSAY